MGKTVIKGQPVQFVCKFAIDKATPKQLYFNDVEAQVFAKVWAAKFNEAKPPRSIDYIDCFVLELVDRPGRPLTGCEIYLGGTFTKKNNNVGATVTPGEKLGVLSASRTKLAGSLCAWTSRSSEGEIWRPSTPRRCLNISPADAWACASATARNSTSSS